MQPSITSQLTEFEDYLILKNFSLPTRKMYLRTLKRFLKFASRKFPREPLSQDVARKYILDRHKNNKSWSTINCDYSSLRKYFREVAQLDWTLKKMPRPRKDLRLPQTLSLQDVTKLINCASTYKHQIFITFVYVTGLRLSEATNVTFDDIDRNRLQIRVRHGKGGKDRYIRIPETLIDILSEYYKRMKPKKYLFNGHKIGGRYCTSSGQWTMRQARKHAGITKQASVHTLRHAYATHHLENGTDLVYLKQQLGHKHLKTTELYIHLCGERKTYVNHPIDQIVQDISWIGRSEICSDNMEKPISGSIDHRCNTSK
jgi:site-specific recombinase XerD